jgi:hypothetical protein
MFDSRQEPTLLTSNPPSSSPFELYQTLRAEATRGDLHGAFIAAKRVALAEAALKKERDGVITEAQADEVLAIIRRAVNADFTPVMYVIPYGLVRDCVQQVAVDARAHPLSCEYVVVRLKRDRFHVLTLD